MRANDYQLETFGLFGISKLLWFNKELRTSQLMLSFELPAEDMIPFSNYFSNGYSKSSH